MAKILHIRFQNLQIQHKNGIEQSSFSITHEQKQYFSSTFDHQNTKIEDDIIIRVKQTVPEIISLQRWQNCMIVFNFQVELPELKTRGFTRKKIQTRQSQILTLTFSIYQTKDVMFSDKYLQHVSQHYLIIEDVYFSNQTGATRANNAANYFTITCKNTHYTLPVRASHVLIKLPTTIQIASFINNSFNGKSDLLDYQKLTDAMEVQLNKGGKGGKIILKLRWAINLHRFQLDQNVLQQANQVLLYDAEIKIDNLTEVQGCKLKIMHNGRAYEFPDQIDHNKTTKIKKIAHFIIKSQSEQVDFFIHRNGKIVSFARMNTSQIVSYSLTIIKKKWPQISNPAKFLGFIKIKAQRAKNVSIPQSNRYWRQALRNRLSTTSMMIVIEQPSVYYQKQKSLSLQIKVENQQKIVKQLPNLNYFSDVELINQSLQFSTKGQESIYLVVKEDINSNDFCGIGVINTSDLRLGLNVCEVGFFKNQEKAGTINCLINKLAFWPFIKPLYQAESAPVQQNPQTLDIFLNKIAFSSYLYTYRYDNKQQIYCIIELNKIKKVLFLQKNQHDDLSFSSAPGSDQLTYNIDQPETIKIKITFLVSDLGHQEEIYGTAQCKIKGTELQQKEIKLKDVQIINEYSVNLGFLSLEIAKSAPPKITLFSNAGQTEKKSIGSFDLSQASFDTQLNDKLIKSPSRRYSGGYINYQKPKIHDFLKKNANPPKNAVNQVKLPVIKEKKDKNAFQDLIMKVRKRDQGGRYQLDGSKKKITRQIRKQVQSFDLKKLQQSNPNINRNLQILFPKKANQNHVQISRSKQIDYTQKLKGLQSVLNQISDVGEVQPSIRESNQPQQREETSDNKQYEAQWQGNQFAQN